MHRRLLGATAVALLPLALTACSGGDDAQKNLDTLDAELVDANATDPAVTAALQDQIMVDPQLAGRANGDAVRPPSQPYAAPVPSPGVAAGSRAQAGETLLSTPAASNKGACASCDNARQTVTLGQLASQQKGTAQCAPQLQYAAGWANRLPADLPLHPDARVKEAAGAHSAQCQLRVVSFSVAAPMQRVLDWYYTRVTRAGYSAGHEAADGEHVLGGTRARDGGAYVLFLRPGDGGTSVDMVVNKGV